MSCRRRSWHVVLAAVALVAATPVGSARAAADRDPFAAAGVIRMAAAEPPAGLTVRVAGDERVPLTALRGRPVMIWVFAAW